MKYTQVETPNVNVGATRGWCLGYMSDTIPNETEWPSTAQAAYQSQLAAGKVHIDGEPIGVWVPLWFSINGGPYVGQGHVAWYYSDGTSVQIHDSEVHAGARKPYTSIAEVLGWFNSAGAAMRYLGWSEGLEGATIVKAAEVVTEKIIEEIKNMEFKYNIKGGGATYYYDGQKSFALSHADQLAILDAVATALTGKALPAYEFETKAWHDRFLQATGQADVTTTNPNAWH